jgi:hypothetical protein
MARGAAVPLLKGGHLLYPFDGSQTMADRYRPYASPSESDALPPPGEVGCDRGTPGNLGSQGIARHETHA